MKLRRPTAFEVEASFVGMLMAAAMIAGFVDFFR
jgi:hypothetical protein